MVDKEKIMLETKNITMNFNDNHLNKRIFIWEFVWTEDLIKHIIQLCNEKGFEICGWAVRRKDIKRIIDIWPDAPVYEAPLPLDLDEINYESDMLHSFSFEEEENIRFLLDREGAYQNNMHSSQTRYEVYAWVETILRRTNPNWILFPDVPHNIFTYLLYLSAKRKGIKTRMIRYGFPPHLFIISESVEREIFKINSESLNGELSLQTNEYLNALRLDDAQPIYMLNQKLNSKPFQVLMRIFAKGRHSFSKKSISAAVTHIKRIQLKRYYESICVSNLEITKTNPYIVVFLHLQPERTSMPEGGIYAQQWLMVQMLSKVCAVEGFDLYVKEHPSTFMTGPKLYRGRWFYNSLKALPKVSLVSLSVKSTEILRNAKAVATITGTVGLEAVLKGIPAFIFGESIINGCAGTHRIKNQFDLNSAILSIQNGVEIEFEDIKKFFSALENDENCYNTKLPRTANHSSLWAQGIPQTVMFSKMVKQIENQELT